MINEYKFDEKKERYLKNLNELFNDEITQNLLQNLFSEDSSHIVMFINPNSEEELNYATARIELLKTEKEVLTQIANGKIEVTEQNEITKFLQKLSNIDTQKEINDLINSIYSDGKQVGKLITDYFITIFYPSIIDCNYDLTDDELLQKLSFCSDTIGKLDMNDVNFINEITYGMKKRITSLKKPEIKKAIYVL